MNLSRAPRAGVQFWSAGPSTARHRFFTKRGRAL